MNGEGVFKGQTILILRREWNERRRDNARFTRGEEDETITS
jgi:hypothetical protein